MIEVYAPASIGNFAVGFDALGAALAPIDGSLLGDVAVVSAAPSDEFVCSGEYAHKLPSDPSENLAYQCLVHFRAHVAPEMSSVKLELKKNLPIGSGLGSSACSVVATFAALDKFADTNLSQVELIELMADFEAIVSGGRHYDNITPCYLGGLQLTGDLIPDKSIALPVDENWYYVAAFPGFSLNTAKARSVLPKELSMHAGVEFAQRLSAFSSLLLTQRFDDALSIMQDDIAEPYRAPLITGFSEAKANLPALGAEVVSISGAGPTLFTVCKTLEAAKQCASWLENNYINEQGFCHICKLDNDGTRQLTVL
ncbi:homoserine kinase [Pseudoalteromonas espejiana DSM 9414]|uniref:Homoserine kinase n=1 Tax=Pseudoalteromonas espejiana TaxID=28107 RepID=A0A510XXP1_9GAMM|nr:homoserine kinase [Pseudoalteromonas espejiana]ASM49057.1 homoserine kinase [Pseudoalteromonas espejiana DSM 9414]GEK55813.1 homoserine kinase [Pseudoalteromonas espejiana]